MKILITEDDARIANFVAKGLRAEGYVTVVASTGAEALLLIQIRDESPDLVLLDLGLPDQDGLTVLRKMRGVRPELPVIILTARRELGEKVRGLDAGARDYVTKPFAFEELLARIRATLRDCDQETLTTLVVGDLRLDLQTKIAWRGERRIELARREWALLELLMRNPTKLLSRMQILNQVWDYGFDPGSNVVDVYVGYLRRKVNGPGETPLIQTVRGAGYRLTPP